MKLLITALKYLLLPVTALVWCLIAYYAIYYGVKQIGMIHLLWAIEAKTGKNMAVADAFGSANCNVKITHLWSEPLRVGQFLVAVDRTTLVSLPAYLHY